jgi:hypothetical protein
VPTRTIERSFAKAEGRVPAPSRITRRPLKSRPQLELHTGLEAARRHYLDRCAEPGVDLDAEREMVVDALHEIAGKRRLLQ